MIQLVYSHCSAGSSGLNLRNYGIVVYPRERHVRQDKSSQNEELARDNQFLLDTLIEMDARLQKIESSSKKGNGTKMILKRIYYISLWFKGTYLVEFGTKKLSTIKIR